MPRKRMPDGAGEDRSKRVTPSAAEKLAHAKGKIRKVRIAALEPHPLQPAERHAPENILDLITSIEEKGVLQPIGVSRRADGSLYILFGHRRWNSCRILASQGRFGGTIPALVLDGLTLEEEMDLMVTELFHREDNDHVVSVAGMIGRAWEVRSDQLGRAATIREMAAIIPNKKKTQIDLYLTIYEALQDEALAPLVRSADKTPIAVLCKALRPKEFSAKRELLEALIRGGPKELQAVLNRRKGGRPLKPVVVRKIGSRRDVSLRYWPGMEPASARLALDELDRLAPLYREVIAGDEREAA